VIAEGVVAIRLVGGMAAPSRLDVEFYHCKFSHSAIAGSRVSDLYEVCGQAQKSIWWASSLEKRTDLFTHLMRRESGRVSRQRPSRLERGTMELLQTLREVSRAYPVNLSINIVQPGLARSTISLDQLQLLGVTENHLFETYQLPLGVVASG
jgi:hypothetical protein